MDWRVLSHIFPISILRGVQTSVHWWSTPNLYKGYSWNQEKHARTSIRNHFFFPTSYPWTHCMLQQCLTARVHCEDLTSHAQLNPGWLERTVSCLVSVCAVFVVWKPLESFGIAALTGISLRHCVMNPKYQPKLAKHWLKLVRGFDRSIFFRFCIYHPWDLPCWDAYHRTPLVAYASRRPRSQVKCLPPGGSNYGGCSWGYGCKFKLGSTPYNLGYNPHN